MNIKVAGKDDEDKVLQLMKEFMEYYREKHPEWGSSPFLSREELLWSFHDALKNPQTAAFILVEEEDEPIAISSITFWYGMNMQDTVITIDDLYVKNKWRNLGVGSRIVEFVVEMGRRMGFSLIEVMLEDRDTRAEEFCKKLGFRKTENHRYQKKIKLAV